MITDAEIIKELETKKKRGFDKLFKKYYKPLCIFSIKYVDTLFVAEDIVQDIFIKIWNRKEYVSIKNLSTYLFVCTKNTCIDYIRKKKPLYVDEYDETIHPFEYYSQKEIDEKVQLLKKKIEELPPKTKEVFKAIVFNNMKYKEVAKKFDVSINTVKSNLSRAYKILRRSTDFMTIYLLSFFSF